MRDNAAAVGNLERTRGLVFKAAGWGLLVFLLSLGAQWLVYEQLLHDPGGMRLISPAIAASVTALLILRMYLMERDRAKVTVRALQTIADMNHHIRNALQVIAFESYPSAETNRHIHEAVSRIEWTLREVLPGFDPRTVGVHDQPARAKSAEGAK